MRRTTEKDRRFVFFIEHPLMFDEAVINRTDSNTAGNDLSPSNNKVFYDTNLIKLAGPKLIHDQFAKTENIPRGRSKTIEFRGLEPLAKALTPLEEGVTPNGQKLDMFTVTATVKQYGGYVTLTDMLDLTAIDPMVLEAQDKLGDQAGRTLDTITREVVNAGTNVQYAEGQVTSRAEITKDMKLTVKAIKKAVRTLKRQDAVPFNGGYAAVIHPDVWYDFTEDTDYKEMYKYLDNNSMKHGYVGDVAGVKFYESTEAKIFVKAGAPENEGGEKIDVYSTLVIGKDAYATTKVTGGGLETIIHQLGSGGSTDPLNQRSTVGWKATKVAVILTQQYMVRIETASDVNNHEAN